MKPEKPIQFVVKFGTGYSLIVHAVSPKEAYEKAKHLGEIASIKYMLKKGIK